MAEGDAVSPAEVEARALEAKADKKRKSIQIFGNKHEDAFELYEKAVALLKLSKRFHAAGSIYMKMADCQLTLNSKHEAASAYVEAAQCFKKTSPVDAIAAYRLASDMFVDMGKFTQAARYRKEIAQIHEAEMNLQEAIEHYRQAADFFGMEESASTAMECQLKVALFSAQLEKYDDAIALYEDVAAKSADNRLRSFSVRDYLLRAGLCLLAKGDLVACQNAVRRYGDLDPAFAQSREGKLFADLVDALEKQDADKFTQTVFDFDQLSKLDNWKTTLLLRVKRRLQQADENPDFT